MPLTLDHKDTPLLECLGPDQLFNLIWKHIPRAQRSPFTKALLVAFEEYNQFHSGLSARWLMLWGKACWDEFQDHCVTLSRWATDTANISHITLRGILDHSTLIFAKRRLGWYNKQFLKGFYLNPLPEECKKIGTYLFDHRHLLDHDELFFTELDPGKGVQTMIMEFDRFREGEATLESKYINESGEFRYRSWDSFSFESLQAGRPFLS